MALYFRSEYPPGFDAPQIIEELNRSLVEKEKELEIKDAYCILVPNTVEAVYYSFIDDDRLVELIQSPDLALKGIIFENIEKKSFVKFTTVDGAKLYGSGVWYLKSRR